MLDEDFVRNLVKKDNEISEYLLSLYNIPVQINAKTIIELGAGESTFALTAAANKTEGEFYSIDIGEGAVERYSPGGLEVFKNEPRYHFIQGDDRKVVKTWNKGIDFLFLDTTHIYSHTKQELEEWIPFVVGGGVIAMHDTAHQSGDGTGCRKALDEFLEKNPDNFTVVHLLDTKHLGMSILVRLWVM